MPAPPYTPSLVPRAPISLRHRLLVVSLLAAVACVAALLTVTWLARTSDTQRTDRARDTVTREIDRLRDTPEVLAPPTPGPGPRPPRRGPPSGYLDAALQPTRPDAWTSPGIRTARDAVARESAAQRALVVKEFQAPRPMRRMRGAGDGPPLDGTLVMAVAPDARGGFVWASSWVPETQGSSLWRFGVLVLALSTLGLVAMALHTMRRFERGASALSETLAALALDLGAPVERPALTELAVVSDGISSLARALTESQLAQSRLQSELAQKERLASLGRVAAGVAHEVRNPLASIKLRVDLVEHALRPRPEHAALAADLSEVGAEILRLDRLVADLLVVAGRRAGPKSHADLGALVRRRAALLTHLAESHDVTLAVDGDAHAEIDADGLTRAFDNLLRNAIEASPKGGAVRVKVGQDAAGATIEVSDEGKGVAPERLGELFEPFFTTKPEGTGLGLALSRAVAVAHGGALTYQRDGAVTRFVLTTRSAHGDRAGGG